MNVRRVTDFYNHIDKWVVEMDTYNTVFSEGDEVVITYDDSLVSDAKPFFWIRTCFKRPGMVDYCDVPKDIGSVVVKIVIDQSREDDDMDYMQLTRHDIHEMQDAIIDAIDFYYASGCNDDKSFANLVNTIGLFFMKTCNKNNI